MKTQNYNNHVRMHPIYHYVLSLLVLASLILAIMNVINALRGGENILQSLTLLLMAMSFIITFILLRFYPLRAQDRAIRAEENLRHYVLTGKTLDPNLTMGQIIALRFASDNEFPSLSEKAVEKNLNPKEIKNMIENWRGDFTRV